MHVTGILFAVLLFCPDGKVNKFVRCVKCPHFRGAIDTDMAVICCQSGKEERRDTEFRERIDCIVDSRVMLPEECFQCEYFIREKNFLVECGWEGKRT